MMFSQWVSMASVKHRSPVLRHEHHVGVQQRHAVPGTAIARGCCHRRPLQSGDADALPVSHRTDIGPAGDAGAGVRVLPGGVQRRAESPRRGVWGSGEVVRQRDSALRDHRGQDHYRASLVVRGAECGVGAVGQRLPPRLAQFLRLNQWETSGSAGGPAAVQIPQGSPAVVSAYPQRVQPESQRPAVRGQSRRGAGALVTRATQHAVVGHDHSGTRWPFLRQFRCRRWGLTAARGGPGGRCGCRGRSVGHDRHHRWPSGRCRQSEAFGSQAAEAAAVGAGEVSTAERIGQQGQVAAQGSRRAPTRLPVLGGTITTSRLWRWFARIK